MPGELERLRGITPVDPYFQQSVASNISKGSPRKDLGKSVRQGELHAVAQHHSQPGGRNVQRRAAGDPRLPSQSGIYGNQDPDARHHVSEPVRKQHFTVDQAFGFLARKARPGYAHEVGD